MIIWNSSEELEIVLFSSADIRNIDIVHRLIFDTNINLFGDERS